MGAVWRLIEAHQDAQPYGASIRSIAKAAGMKHTTLAGFRDLAADTGYSIARVRTLLECADAAIRPRGAAQAADQH